VSPLAALDIDRLTVEQKLDLIGLLWDSILNNGGGLPFPDWHLRELKKRIADANANPGTMIPWKELRVELRGRS
jgi:putative addiction module component (TIGR02574 family)